jgi:hypothetical protein
MKKHIPRLQVAMNDTLAVSVSQGSRDLNDETHDLQKSKAPLAKQTLFQRLTREQFHYEKGHVVGGLPASCTRTTNRDRNRPAAIASRMNRPRASAQCSKRRASNLMAT